LIEYASHKSNPFPAKNEEFAALKSKRFQFMIMKITSTNGENGIVGITKKTHANDFLDDENEFARHFSKDFDGKTARNPKTIEVS
jgi:hypothetical protein